MVALSTFANELRGRCVILYSDNKGAEGATARGSAKVCTRFHPIVGVYCVVCVVFRPQSADTRNLVARIQIPHAPLGGAGAFQMEHCGLPV